MFQNLNSPFQSCGYNCFVYIFLIITNVHFTIEHDHFYIDNNHHTENRLSLESCLGRFDVHGNTIIRTGESQAIGGKFLQGLELETPEKCQRLCCETTDCDVYVFEEKNDGYCYLFQCGSPKNFHCKFTRHANYTSALLTQFKTTTITTTPRPVIYIPKMNISTQEQELISLKAKPDKYLVTSTTQPISQSHNENGLIAAVPESRNLSCGRFEFPCHSGECIAVYNACNGIPQCVDGSDEGPECMDPTNTKTNNNNYREHVKPEILHDSSIYRHSLRDPMVDNSNSENRHPMILKETKNPQNDVTNDLDTISSLNNNNGHIQNVLSLERPTGKLIQIQAEMYEQLPEVKSSFSTPHLGEEKAHIFNENSKWPTQQRQQYHIATHEPPFSVLNQPMTNSGNDHKQVQSVVAVDEEMTNINSGTFNRDSETGQRLQNNANQVGKSSEQAGYSDKAKESTKKDMAPRKDEPPVSPKKAPHPAFVEQYKAMEQHLEIKFIDHDGHAEKPRGAVLSLTLGLMITAMIVIMIGCRLRTIGRRGSRHGGKTPYAPDEDFLVNGMYL